MNQKSIMSKSIAAAASLVLSITAAHAASLVNTGTGADGAGELFIDVTATGGTGQGKSVVIDAGAVSTYANAAAGSTFSIGSLGTDLTNTFGSWQTRSDLVWSAVAAVQGTVPTTSTDLTNTLYGSVASNGQYPITTTPYNRASNSTQSSVAQRIISNMATGAGGFTSAATGSASNIGIEGASDTNNYATWMPGGSNVSGLGNVPFGGFGNPPGQNFQQTLSSGTGNLDVYQMYRTNVAQPDAGNATTGAGAYEFTLSLGNTGAITANVLPLAAVPEPASIGALTSVALLGVGSLRRKRAARA